MLYKIEKHGMELREILKAIRERQNMVFLCLFCH